MATAVSKASLSTISRNCILQGIFVFSITLACFLLSAWLSHSIVSEYLLQEDFLPNSAVETFLKRLVDIGKFPQVLVDPVIHIYPHARERDVIHLCGAIGEFATIVLCCAVPKTFLKFGYLSFSVLPPLAFVLSGLAASLSNNIHYCNAFGYFLILASSQTQAVTLSCLLQALKAQITGVKMTSRVDLVLFWLLLAVMFTAVTYFSLRFHFTVNEW